MWTTIQLLSHTRILLLGTQLKTESENKHLFTNTVLSIFGGGGFEILCSKHKPHSSGMCVVAVDPGSMTLQVLIQQLKSLGEFHDRYTVATHSDTVTPTHVMNCFGVVWF